MEEGTRPPGGGRFLATSTCANLPACRAMHADGRNAVCIVCRVRAWGRTNCRTLPVSFKEHTQLPRGIRFPYLLSQRYERDVRWSPVADHRGRLPFQQVVRNVRVLLRKTICCVVTFSSWGFPRINFIVDVDRRKKSRRSNSQLHTRTL